MRRISVILTVSFLLLTVISVAHAQVNHPPVADANGPYLGMVGIPVSFDGSGSSDPDGDPLTCEWDMDNDGEYDDAFGVMPTHTFLSVGIFTVGLSVSDGMGAEGRDSAAVTIMDMPVASFTESAHVAPVGTPITFDPSGSYDPDGPIILYEWDFDGDGVYDLSTTTLSIVSHTYTIPGTYTVTLRVTDFHGNSDTASNVKTITPLGVIPEVPLGTIIASTAMIIAFVAYVAVPKWRRKRAYVSS